MIRSKSSYNDAWSDLKQPSPDRHCDVTCDVIVIEYFSSWQHMHVICVHPMVSRRNNLAALSMGQILIHKSLFPSKQLSIGNSHRNYKISDVIPITLFIETHTISFDGRNWNQVHANTIYNYSHITWNTFDDNEVITHFRIVFPVKSN